MMKPLRLLSLLPTRSREFYDRVYAIATSRWEASLGGPVEYRTINLEEALFALSEALNSDCAVHFLEPTLSQIEGQVRDGETSLPLDGPFATFHNGDSALARFCYAMTRALRPKLVVETGVCYGVTSAYVLEALDANQKGHLHSIDLPPLGKDADRHVGRLIPTNLRSRWTLHRGVSGRVFPPLLARVGRIDLFIHDSLHTCRNMRMEFGVAWPALRPGGILVSDDVEGNLAFQELSALPDVAVSAVIKEQSKGSLFGVAVKRG